MGFATGTQLKRTASTRLVRWQARLWLGTQIGRLLIRHPSEVYHLRRWRRAYTTECSALQDRLPWITFRARAWLIRVVGAQHRVFEWGSGGSTMFWCDRAARVVSVEHDPQWFRRVRETLDHEAIKHCQYILAEPPVSDDAEYPSQRMPGREFRNYVQAIDRFEDHGFDFILVDGRARVACIQRAESKLRPGGFLIVDNSDREEYAPAYRRLMRWRRFDFFGLGPYRRTPWQTSVWQAGPG